MSELESLARALTGGSSDARDGVSDDLAALAEDHGVDALLAVSPAMAASPAGVQARLRARRAAHEALCAVRDAELRRVLEALDRGGLQPLVIKGAHLAHTLYALPALRPRADSDLVIDPDACGRAAAVLHDAGYAPAVHVRGRLILGQWHFRREEACGIVHALDLHWRLTAPLVLREVLPAAALRGAARPIGGLGASAIGPAPHHALVIACVHLIAHHRQAPLLLWLYDISTLAASLTDDEVVRFAGAARDGRVIAICREAVARAGRYFDPPGASRAAVALDAARPAGAEASAALMRARGPLDELRLDLRACDGWRERLTLLREHAYPDRAYMRATAGSGEWLPWAYGRRLASGLRRWRALSGARDRTAAPDGSRAGPGEGSPLPRSARTIR